jgi:beta-galactosidase
MGITTLRGSIQISVCFCFSCLVWCSIASAATPLPSDGKSHQFSARDGQFKIDGQPIEIIAGEIHPSRIPYQFWEDRIKKARAMGLNTVSVYIFWNQLEPTDGQFNWEGCNDIRRFVKICQINGLWVILRPGPYVCAETEFGGYPAWLLKNNQFKIRTDDPVFMRYCQSYMTALHDQIGDLQVTHGGPILMVQIENEYANIDKYLDDLRKIFITAGFDTQLYTCDHSGPVWNIIQGMPGILRATNGLPNATKLSLAQKVAGGFPVYGSEVYTSWYSVWADYVGGPRGKQKSVATQIKDTQWLLDRHLSFCFYLFDGGTNFGFSNGSNGWQPVQTTYDYDAPVDELGRVKPKFKALRDLFIQTLHIAPPPIPADPKVIEIPKFQISNHRSLLSSLPKPTLTSDDVVTMEDLDQSYGLIDYRKSFPNGIKGTLNLRKALDYSIVMLDGQVVGQAFHAYGPKSFQINLAHPASCTLDILVYNLGRNSVGINQSISRKGLNENPTLDGTELKGWQIYSLPMDDPSTPPLLSPSPGTPGRGEGLPQVTSPNAPEIFTGSFNLAETGETYLDMRNWNFGVVWVNGHNLGRYWDVGADRGLYLPSAWQNQGANQITILELAGPPKSTEIQGVANMVIERATPYSPYPHKESTTRSSTTGGINPNAE